ncbi:hypothetical protein [Massilia frigida]|nr:hypothetical protein [Massilia frigida]
MTKISIGTVFTDNLTDCHSGENGKKQLARGGWRGMLAAAVIGVQV